MFDDPMFVFWNLFLAFTIALLAKPVLGVRVPGILLVLMGMVFVVGASMSISLDLLAIAIPLMVLGIATVRAKKWGRYLGMIWLSALTGLSVFGDRMLARFDNLVYSTPSIQDLAGVYRLSAASEEFLRSGKSYASIPLSEIELKQDSRGFFRGLPDCTIDGFGESHGQFLSAAGLWRIDKEFLGYSLSLEIEPGGTLEPGIYGGIEILGRSPPHRLKIILGDPDSGESIQYERRGTRRVQ